jgi:hypothetical protein
MTQSPPDERPGPQQCSQPIGQLPRPLGSRILRQLLWHGHRLVQMRTRIMNQLQALAMNEGYRWKKKLFGEQGRALLQKLSLALWASRRRRGLVLARLCRPRGFNELS